MTVGSPAANTACAASGSAQTLNSAAAVTLPPRARGPAHDDQPADPCRGVGEDPQQQGEVGQRADRRDGDRLR